MKNNKKISSILAVTLAGVLLASPLNYAKAEENSATSSVTSDSTEKVIVTKWVEILEEDTKEKETTAEKDTKPKTEEEKKKEEEEKSKPKEKELKPEAEGDKAEEAGEIEGYEFVRTDESEPGVVKHIFKKKEVTTKWEDTEGNELKKPEKDKKEKEHGTIDGYKYDRTTSKDGKTITHIFKKDDSKPSDDKTTTSESKTSSDDSTKKSDDTKPSDEKTTQTTEAPVVTTSTDKNGAQAPIVNTETTQASNTKDGSKDTKQEEPKYRSIFINKVTGAQIVSGRAGKEKISIDGFEYVNTIEAQEGVFVHYYKQKGTNDSQNKLTTVWQDIHSGKQLLPTKEGKQDAGYIAGYTFVKTNTYASTGTVIHYFKKVQEENKYNYHWAYHVDIDTGEMVYYDFYRSGWWNPVSINGYVYVDTDSWTDRAGITYHTHYYKKISRSVAQIDPNKVFTVWVDEYYNQILPSKMGSYEAGELEGYEFEKTISVNDGYGIAHVFKKVDGEDRLAGKDTDKSLGYRVKSLLPRTSATGETNYLPLGIAAVVGAGIGAGVFYLLRRKNNNNNNFPPFPGQ